MKLCAKEDYCMFLCLLFSTVLASDYDEGMIHVGAGLGIQSYPSALDPFQLAACVPVFYPEIDANIQVMERIFLTSAVSRTAVEGSLLGSIWCQQKLELYTVGYGLDYNFGSRNRAFKTGIQLLIGFSEYGTGNYDDYYSSGMGVNVYACTIRSLTRHFSWGMRTGVRRLRIRVLPHSERLTIDSFYIETTGYIAL